MSGPHCQWSNLAEPTNGHSLRNVQRPTLSLWTDPSASSSSTETTVQGLEAAGALRAASDLAHRPSRLERRHTRVHACINAITEALDQAASPVEQSNAFDRWKQALGAIAREEPAPGIAFRQVLGMLIAAAHRKDISDFLGQLPTLGTVTGILGRARLVAADAREAHNTLRRLGCDLLVSLESSEGETGGGEDGESLE